MLLCLGILHKLGNIAIYDKFTRANIACNYGADLVIELPTIFANSSAEFFSHAAIKLLNNLNIVDCICFGSEVGDISILNTIATKIIDNQNSIWEDIKKTNDMPFAKARQLAIEKYIGINYTKYLSKPNNILGIEYIKALRKLNSNIEAFSLKREISDFREQSINIANFNYTSATSIRNHIATNSNCKNLKNYIPKDTFDLLTNDSPLFNENLFELLKYKILMLSKEELSNIQEVTEGLENRIISSVNNSKNYNEFINNIKTKKYNMSKIKRMLNNIVLNITKSDFKNTLDTDINYAHILATSKDGKSLLSRISKESSIEVITSINENNLKNLDNNILKLLNQDILASNIYSILKCEAINKDYTNRL